MDTGKLDSLFNNMAQQLTPEHMEQMLNGLNMAGNYSEDNQENEDQENQETQQEDQYNVNDFDIDSESDISDLSAHEMEKVIIKDINVLVSSLDRDWFNRDDEDIYNFEVKLGSSGSNDTTSSENFLMVNYKFKNIDSNLIYNYIQ